MGADEGARTTRKGFLDAIRVLEAMLAGAPGEIDELAGRIARAVEAGGRVYLFGNGGSAAEAQHIACELVGRLRGDRKAIPATAFSTDTSVLTAVGNDRGFEAIFVRQVEAHVRDGDVVIGISTSGRSPNVLKGLKAAKERGAITVGLTGKEGAGLSEVSAYLLKVPSSDTPRVQEAHGLIGHLLCEEIENRLQRSVEDPGPAQP